MWDGREPDSQDEYLKMNEKLKEKMVDEKMELMKKLQLTQKVQSSEDEDEKMRSKKKNFLWDETRLTRL